MKVQINQMSRSISTTRSPLYSASSNGDEEIGEHSTEQLDPMYIDRLNTVQNKREHHVQCPKEWSRTFKCLKCTSIGDFGFKLGSIVYVVMLTSGYIIGRNSKQVAVKYATASCACLMVIWWLTEAVPLAVTALLPLVLLPITGVAPAGTISAAYFSDAILLFMGTFILAAAVEEHGLHLRLAQSLLVGMEKASHPGILFKFIASTGFISMWLNNTASAAMMMPLADAIFSHLVSLEKEKHGNSLDLKTALHKISRLKTATYLGIAYSASLGGMSTLTGTGPNIILHGVLQVSFPDGPELSFISWLAMVAPIAWGAIIALWVLLCLRYLRSQHKVELVNQDETSEERVTDDDSEINEEVEVDLYSRGKRRGANMSHSSISHSESHEEREDDGVRESSQEPLNWSQKVILVDFCLLVLAWFTRSPQGMSGWSGVLVDPTYPTDATAAMASALILFLIPEQNPCIDSVTEDGTAKKSGGIIGWKVMNQLPWDVIFLLGGGYALSVGFNASGLASAIASFVLPQDNEEGEKESDGGSFFVILVSAVLLSSGLSNLVSNVATANIVLPLLTCVAVRADSHPWLILIPATLACSFAFLFPVGTPPNAIAYGSGNIPIQEMAVVGTYFTALVYCLLALGVFVIFPAVLNTQQGGGTPEWALSACSKNDD